jgi:hypothetical protein
MPVRGLLIGAGDPQNHRIGSTRRGDLQPGREPGSRKSTWDGRAVIDQGVVDVEENDHRLANVMRERRFHRRLKDTQAISMSDPR